MYDAEISRRLLRHEFSLSSLLGYYPIKDPYLLYVRESFRSEISFRLGVPFYFSLYGL